MRRAAFTLAEALIVVVLATALVGTVVYLLVHGTALTARLTPQLSLQQGGRRAVVRLLREIQEGMEVVVPRPGSTQPYAVVRDRVSLLRWFYQVRSADGRTCELWRYVDDPALPLASRRELMLGSIKRLTFTSRSEASVQVNLVLAEADQEYALLTTVRLRNIAAAEEIW